MYDREMVTLPILNSPLWTDLKTRRIPKRFGTGCYQKGERWSLSSDSIS